jgi:hypothetical protein
LNLLESVSVVVAVLYCPNTSEPFNMAAFELLKSGKPRLRGFDFGYDILKAIAAAYDRKELGLRFNLYKSVHVPTDGSFFGRCRFIFWIRMHVSAAYPSQPTNASVHGVYVKICSLVETIPGIGPLTAMHVIQILAEMGLPPSWLQTHAPKTAIYRRSYKLYIHYYPAYGARIIRVIFHLV